MKRADGADKLTWAIKALFGSLVPEPRGSTFFLPRYLLAWGTNAVSIVFLPHLLALAWADPHHMR